MCGWCVSANIGEEGTMEKTLQIKQQRLKFIRFKTNGNKFKTLAYTGRGNLRSKEAVRSVLDSRLFLRASNI